MVQFNIYNTSCLFSREQQEVRIFGHTFTNRLNACVMYMNAGNPVQVTVVYETNKNLLFYLKFPGDLAELEKRECSFEFHFSNEIILTRAFMMHFPFEKIFFPECFNIISTMCKDYNHRLEEWIQYNLKLGFDGIVIFNNYTNTNDETLAHLQQKYAANMAVIDFPYTAPSGFHWNNIQGSSLCIGVEGMKQKCNYIALIDADEFIYIPSSNNNNIKEFLSRHVLNLKIESKLITNKGYSDAFDNDVLSTCRFVGTHKYKKSIIRTNQVGDFIHSPHGYDYRDLLLNEHEIIHYHVWENSRCPYNDSMPEFFGLQKFMNLMN